MNPSAPRRRSDALANRQKILAAAAVVYSEEGLGVTLDRIARAAGVGVGTVYRNFSNKSELIDAVLAERLEAIMELAHSCAAEEDPREGLFRFLRTVGGWIKDSMALGQLLEGRGESQDSMLAARDEFIPLLAELIERAQRRELIRADFSVLDLPMFFTMLGAIQKRTGRVDPGQVDRYLEMLLDAVAHPPTVPAHPSLTEAQFREIFTRQG